MYKRVKRVLSFILAMTATVLLLPLLAILCIAVKLDSPGPVFFRQKRVGLHKKLFDIYKFRTMRSDAPHDVPTHLLDDPDMYITKLGKVMRNTSMDELPQLFNILRGEMCFVGPRPALWNQYDLVAERERYGANDVMPGVTGWAQINGRDELAIGEKARLDGFYAENLSFRLDIKCFCKTIAAVLGRKGIVEGSHGGKAEAHCGEK